MQVSATKTRESQEHRLFPAAVVGAVSLAVAAWLGVRFGGPVALAAMGALAVLVVAVMVHPFIFFSFYFAALFFADTRLPALGLSANQILAVLFFVSYLGYWARGHTMALRSGVTPWLTLLALYFTVNALLGESPPHGQLMARYVVIYYVLALVLATCLRSERSIYAYAWIIVGLTFIAALVGFVEAIQRGTFAAFTGKITDAVRVKGTASTANVYGWNLVFSFPFAFFLFSQVERRCWRYTALAMGLFILFVALLTLSRQTIVLVGLQLIVCARLFSYPSRRMFFGFLVLFLFVGAMLAAPPIVARLLSVTRLARDYSYLERRDSAILCWEVIRARPVFGVGLGSFTAVWRNYLPADYRTFFAQYIEASRPRAPDQGYLQIAAEGGLVGLAIFLGFVSAVWHRWRRVRREALRRGDRFVLNVTALVSALMLHFLATTFTDDTFLYVRVWLIYPLVLLLDERMLFEPSSESAGGEPVACDRRT